FSTANRKRISRQYPQLFFSLSHDEGVPILRSSHNSDARAWDNTAEGGGEGLGSTAVELRSSRYRSRPRPRSRRIGRKSITRTRTRTKSLRSPGGPVSAKQAAWPCSKAPPLLDFLA